MEDTIAASAASRRFRLHALPACALSSVARSCFCGIALHCLSWSHGGVVTTEWDSSPTITETFKDALAKV